MSPDQLVSLIAAGAQVTLAVAALLFSIVIYFDKARVQSDIKLLSDQVAEVERKLEMTELLATKVRELTVDLSRAHAMVWAPVRVRILKSSLNEASLIKRHQEIEERLNRLNDELGLFSHDEEEALRAANRLTRGYGTIESLQLLDCIALLSDREQRDKLKLVYKAMHARLFGRQPISLRRSRDSDSFAFDGARRKRS